MCVYTYLCGVFSTLIVKCHINYPKTILCRTMQILKELNSWSLAFAFPQIFWQFFAHEGHIKMLTKCVFFKKRNFKCLHYLHYTVYLYYTFFKLHSGARICKWQHWTIWGWKFIKIRWEYLWKIIVRSFYWKVNPILFLDLSVWSLWVENGML